MILSDYSTDAQKEGFCLLHSGARGKTLIGVDGKMVNVKCQPDEVILAGKMKNEKCLIGYFAYPNPTLKNDIPDSRFYEFDGLKIVHPLRRRAIDCAPTEGHIGFKTSGHLEQSVTKSEYIQKIKRIKELLAAGEVYQINYAIRFRKKFEGDPYALFLKLAEVNPADFSAYLNCGNFHIISSSPERLFKVVGNKIVTQPIKGTALKGAKSKFSIFNFQNKQYFGDKNIRGLLNSEKERAELDMITDLERNDVGKICEYETLKLTKEREILELKNIWHTYSEVRGKLRSNISSNEIINAMFPGGSITGCPKKRAMQYIEELEGLPRNIFTGSIGYIKEASPQRSESSAKRVLNRTMDFSIAIRTALIQNGYIEYWAGGGIVADSDPEKEYEECLLKAERFLSII